MLMRKFIFGEFTFFPQAGFDVNRRKETDEIFTNKLQIEGGELCKQ